MIERGNGMCHACKCIVDFEQQDKIKELVAMYKGQQDIVATRILETTSDAKTDAESPQQPGKVVDRHLSIYERSVFNDKLKIEKETENKKLAVV